MRLKVGMSLRTLLVFFVLAVAAVALQPARSPARAADSNITTIVHVTVVDVDNGKESRDQTVVLQGDHIVSVAALETNDAPPQGRAIDAHGAYLIPGLWDMHVHIQDLEDLPLYIANGVTGVRLMFGAKNAKDLRAKLAATPFAPDVLIGSVIVDGDPPV